jgi:D-alanyl-D-alanine dipeptidase
VLENQRARTALLLVGLLRNARYREFFLERMDAALAGPLAGANVTARIDRLAAHIAPEMEEELRLVRIPMSVRENDVESMRAFAHQRGDAIRQLILSSGEFSAERPRFLRGDVNGDGRRNLGDAVLLAQFLSGQFETPCEDALDVDDSAARPHRCPLPCELPLSKRLTRSQDPVPSLRDRSNERQRPLWDHRGRLRRVMVERLWRGIESRAARRLAMATAVACVVSTLVATGEPPARLPPRPAPPPKHWRGLIAEYGTDALRVIIFENGGQLRAAIDGTSEHSLKELTQDTYSMATGSKSPATTLRFHRAKDAVATALEFRGARLPRRDSEKNTTFRIARLEEVPVLRKRALAASPPPEKQRTREAELVDLATLDKRFRFDIRYASTNNFMGAAFYRRPQAFLQRPAAEALQRIYERVHKHGFGLLIYDAYRPWYVTKMFWDATPKAMKGFVADPTKGSRHNRGCAVDLTLYDLADDKPVEMVSGYDEFAPRAAANYPGGTSLERWHRKILRDAMEAERFRVLPEEWWHFDFQEWRNYPILNKSFEALEVKKPGE